jgi:hypothetical protein
MLSPNKEDAVLVREFADGSRIILGSTAPTRPGTYRRGRVEVSNWKREMRRAETEARERYGSVARPDPNGLLRLTLGDGDEETTPGPTD